MLVKPVFTRNKKIYEIRSPLLKWVFPVGNIPIPDTNTKTKGGRGGVSSKRHWYEEMVLPNGGREVQGPGMYKYQMLTKLRL